VCPHICHARFTTPSCGHEPCELEASGGVLRLRDLIGFVIGDADLSLAVTVLVGFATIAVLVVAALALELHFRGPRGRVHLSRG
jgi:hypothetical protein